MREELAKTKQGFQDHKERLAEFLFELRGGDEEEIERARFNKQLKEGRAKGKPYPTLRDEIRRDLNLEPDQ